MTNCAYSLWDLKMRTSKLNDMPYQTKFCLKQHNSFSRSVCWPLLAYTKLRKCIKTGLLLRNSASTSSTWERIVEKLSSQINKKFSLRSKQTRPVDRKILGSSFEKVPSSAETTWSPSSILPSWKQTLLAMRWTSDSTIIPCKARRTSDTKF